MLSLAGAGVAEASGGAASRVRAVYRTVLIADYFGPASAVCSHLSKAALKSYTDGGRGSCASAFVQQQRSLRKKTKNVDNSGYTPAQWNDVVSEVMAHLKITVRGRHATAIGRQLGITGETLVERQGRWLFTRYPPSVGP